MTPADIFRTDWHTQLLMLVAIRHTEGDPLAVTLSILQPQLAESDDIYIIDTTPTREGWRIVKKYGTSRSVIFTEVGNYPVERCSTFFRERAVKNGHRGLLYIKNVLFSSTFISNLKKATNKGYGILVPKVLENGEILNPNFKWYNPPTIKVYPCNDYIDRCWYLDIHGNQSVGVFPNEKIVLL